MKNSVITIILLFIYCNNVLAESSMSETLYMSKALYNSINKDTFCLKQHKHCLTDKAKHNWVFKHYDTETINRYNSYIKKIDKLNSKLPYIDPKYLTVKNWFNRYTTKKLNIESVRCAIKGISIEILKMCVEGNQK